MDVIPTKFPKLSANFNRSTVETPCRPNRSLHVLSIIGAFLQIFPLSLGGLSLFSCRLLYEKRNKKKEAKEAAAYEAFQKLKAENRHESAAVNIDQDSSDKKD